MYVGEWQAGKMDGTGIYYTFADRDVYEGSYLSGKSKKACGHGTYRKASGDIYVLRGRVGGWNRPWL